MSAPGATCRRLCQSEARQEAPRPAESLSISSREYTGDDPRFGMDANPTGHVSFRSQDLEAS